MGKSCSMHTELQSCYKKMLESRPAYELLWLYWPSWLYWLNWLNCMYWLYFLSLLWIWTLFIYFWALCWFNVLSFVRIFFGITDGYNNRLAHKRKNIWSDLKNLLQSPLTPCFKCSAYTSFFVAFLSCSFFILKNVFTWGQSLSIN